MTYATTFQAEDFTARAIYTGESRHIYVNGFGTSPTSGFTLTLEYGNPGINPNPAILTLHIVETPPTGAVLDVLTPTPISGDTMFDVSQEVSQVGFLGQFAIPVIEPA